jgi:hypothetical protein
MQILAGGSRKDELKVGWQNEAKGVLYVFFSDVILIQFQVPLFNWDSSSPIPLIPYV